MKTDIEERMYCQLCDGELRKGTLAFHMGCLITRYKVVHGEAL